MSTDGNSPRVVRPLPANAVTARDLLDAHGPMTPEELQARLGEQGVHMGGGLIATLPDRFPEHFEALGDRLTAVQVRSAPDDTSDADAPIEDWWNHLPEQTPFRLDRIWVLDIETTGFDRDTDDVWEIAVENLGTGERHGMLLELPEGRHAALVGPDAGDATALPPGGALDRMAAVLADADAVLGHNAEQFDVPFLAAFARRHGRVWPDLPVLDLHTLSLLVDPTLPHRGLSDLCFEYGVTNDRAHRAAADVAATAALARRLTDEVRPDDPNHALALACLHRAGHPWARALPSPAPAGDLRDALVPYADVLTDAVADALPSARAGVRDGIMRLETDPWYRARRSQHQMAEEVADVLDRGGRLAVEAPTGTGKSLAYLVPALARASASGRPVVVATHTKVLQRQLREDAKRLRELGLLTAPFRQLQGVENYVCPRELADAVASDQGTPDEWLATAIGVRALRSAETGTWDEVTDFLLAGRHHDYRVRRATLRTSSNGCERRDCEWRAQCPLLTRMPEGNDTPGVLSVNHAVLAAWLSAQRDGGRAPSDALGEHQAELVFDEAHTLEDSLASAWTEEASGTRIAGMMRLLHARRGPLALARRAMRLAGARLDVPDGIHATRAGWFECTEAVGERVERYLHEYASDAGSAAIHGPVAERRPEYRAFKAELAELRRMLAAAVRGLQEVQQALEGAASRDGGPALRRATRRVQALARDLIEVVQVMAAFEDLREPSLFVHQLALEDSDGPVGLRWRVTRTPVEVGPRFAEQVVAKARSIVLTSATLAINGSFDFIGSRLGVQVGDTDADGGVRGVQLPSPFDFPAQARLILTNHLPLPVPSSEDAFCEELARDQVGFLSLSRGRALTLFAARSRMKRVADLVDRHADALRGRGVELLVQGRQGVNEIRTRFRAEPGTVAFGVRSYWEGFDAPGATLSYLFIEKPPYPHPNDPLASARQRAISDRGGDPFMDYAVPSAAIAMAQGFGRLIRTETDRGAAMILDRRLQLPTDANTMLLGALPAGLEPVFADSRDDAWTEAIRWVTGTDPDLEDALAVSGPDVDLLLEELRLLPGEDPEVKLRRGAAELFGVEQVKPEQMALMTAVLEGRDVLGLLPTGFGKSLCFQLPALLRPDGRPTVVISPLIALIKDQVDELRGRRRLRPVHGLTGTTSGAVRTDVARELAEGRVRLLYISPERLANDGTLRLALREQQALGALVIDEAHCISSWGHDFRPEFRRIAPSVAELPRSARAGFTATATEAIERDIRTSLEMVDPVIVRASADRPNLRYRAMHFGTDAERVSELLRLVLHVGSTPGIVYTSRRATTEDLAYMLRQAGVLARAYHAGMVPEQREAVQNEFLAGTQQVIVATKAFGMGIDKSDIGWIVHFDLPESLEGYTQEAGRAGRAPGRQADCVLFFTRGDFARRRRQSGRTDPALDPARAQRLLDLVACAPLRGKDRILDPGEACDRLDLDEEQLNALMARLEDVGCVRRRHDCAARGKLQVGLRVPADAEDARRFREIVRIRLGAKVGRGTLIDFGAHPDADDLEERLGRWALQRFVSFWPTRRHWRIRLEAARVPVDRFTSNTARWQTFQKRQLSAMISYAEGGACRRSSIRHYFGEAPAVCGEGMEACDICSGAAPVWHTLSRDRVPDPESLIDVELVLLQAVAWSQRFQSGRYAASGLRFALLGHETYPGTGNPLGRGLLSCPQFGALQHVRAAEKRYDRALESLVAQGAIAVERVSGRAREYESLALTPAGQSALSGTGGGP